MKKCIKCGTNIEDDKVFCDRCEINNLNNPKKTSLTSNQKLFIIIVFVFLILALGTYFYKPSFENIKDSVVKIEVYDDNNDLLATGSGFCAYELNYIITNYHVIEGAYSIKVITDDSEKYDVNNILIFNVSDDLAILDTSANLRPLTFGNTKNLKSGDKISTIGSPLGELNTVSNGIISNADNSKGIQISAALAHGSSGGVLLDKKNRVIGITYASLDDGNNLNYAIKIDKLEEMKKALDEGQFEKLDDTTYTLSNDCIDESPLSLSSALNEIYAMKIEKSHNFFSDLSSNEYKNYSINSIKSFYEKTNRNRIFERIIKYKTSICPIYKTLTTEDKELAVQTYEELVKKDYEMNNYSIRANINSWNLSDFFIRLGVLNKRELAVVMADVKNYSGNSLYNRVNSYSFPTPEKTLIYYLIGDVSWNNISVQNKKQLFDYFNAKGYSTGDLGAILEKLGYRVIYNSNGTLNAYW